MIPALWISKTGLDAQQTNISVASNNLANASTNGFRAELQAFRSVPVVGDGASTRVFSLETTTRAPCATKASAIPSPMPRVEPVTIATLPSSENMNRSRAQAVRPPRVSANQSAI